ncbi:hypothetical protein PV797_15250 [Clostridiaceae bacterium M8S5]|nr:hypothetical protein PV797_15250 [Clostridiaceae bacterium M8S5]
MILLVNNRNNVHIIIIATATTKPIKYFLRGLFLVLKPRVQIPLFSIKIANKKTSNIIKPKGTANDKIEKLILLLIKPVLDGINFFMYGLIRKDRIDDVNRIIMNIKIVTSICG